MLANPTIRPALQTTAGAQTLSENVSPSSGTEAQGPGSFAAVLQNQTRNGGKESAGTVTEGISLEYAEDAPLNATLNDGIAALVAALMSPVPHNTSSISNTSSLSDEPFGTDKKEAADSKDILHLSGREPVSFQSASPSLPEEAVSSTVKNAALQHSADAPPEQDPALPSRKPDAEDSPSASSTDPALAALLALFPPSQTNLPSTSAKSAKDAGDAGDTGIMEASTHRAAAPALTGSGQTPLQAALQSLPNPRANATAAEISAQTASSATTPSSATIASQDPQDRPHFEDWLHTAQTQASLVQNLQGAGEARPSLQAATATTATTVTTTAAKLDTPLHHPGWDKELGDKLVWAFGRHEQRAELVITPPQLGRVEISLHQQGDQTTAVFVAANPVVREALENALPRLREMFAEAGLSLGQASVGTDSNHSGFRQSFANAENRDNSPSYSDRTMQDSEGNMSRLMEKPGWVRQGQGMVDVFA